MGEELPRVFLLDAGELLAIRDRIYAGEEDLQAADQCLIRDADQPRGPLPPPPATQ